VGLPGCGCGVPASPVHRQGQGVRMLPHDAPTRCECNECQECENTVASRRHPENSSKDESPVREWPLACGHMSITTIVLVVANDHQLQLNALWAVHRPMPRQLRHPFHRTANTGKHHSRWLGRAFQRRLVGESGIESASNQVTADIAALRGDVDKLCAAVRPLTSDIAPLRGASAHGWRGWLWPFAASSTGSNAAMPKAPATAPAADVAALRECMDELIKALDVERLRHAEAEAALGRRLDKLEAVGQQAPASDTAASTPSPAVTATSGDQSDVACGLCLPRGEMLMDMRS